MLEHIVSLEPSVAATLVALGHSSNHNLRRK